MQTVLEREGVECRLNAKCIRLARRGAFTHTSYNDYEIVAANLLDADPRRVTDRIPAYALFIDPSLARVGMTEKEVRAAGPEGRREGEADARGWEAPVL